MKNAPSVQVATHKIKHVSDEKCIVPHRQYSQDPPKPKVEERVPIRIRLFAVFQPVLLEQRRQLSRYLVKMLNLKRRVRRNVVRALQAF